jgi:hypothetical protein
MRVHMDRKWRDGNVVAFVGFSLLIVTMSRQTVVRII